MEEINFNGKFKEDFIEWLRVNNSLNTNIVGEFIEIWHLSHQIEYMMKFLHKINYRTPYYIENHKIYSIHQMNELIKNYNNAKQQ